MNAKKSDTTQKEKTTVNGLMIDVVSEAKKLAKNETTSCYELIKKTKELIQLEKLQN